MQHQHVNASMEVEEKETEDNAIFSTLDELECLRTQGQLPHSDAATRLYQARGGDFIRVLDHHEAPLSPGMVYFCLADRSVLLRSIIIS